MIDVSEHRQNANYAKHVLVQRVLWAVLYPLFRWSPRHLYAWRNFLLRLLGAKIGKGVQIYPSARVFYPWNVEIGDDVIIGWDVELYSLGKIKIASDVMVSQHAHLCAGSHDYRKPNFPLLTPPIIIESGCWICSRAFVGPNVTIGEGSVVGACAVVFKDVAPRSLMVGNPAECLKEIKPRRPSLPTV